MSLAKKERGNTFRSYVVWKSGSSYTDPSSNMSYFEVYKPDGTLYYSESGLKNSTGIFDYYVSTQTDDSLGIYKIRHWGYFNYGSPWYWERKQQTIELQIVDVI